MNFLHFLAGIDDVAIKDAGLRERNSYSILGLAILIPSLMSWFGMYHQVSWFGYEGLSRIMISTVWSLIILVIDVLLVYTLKKPKKLFEKGSYSTSFIFFGKALFRLSISILLGYYISQPLIIKNYESEVEQELVFIKKELQDSLKIKRESQITFFTVNDSLKLKELWKRKECLEYLVTAERNGSDTILPCGETSKLHGYGDRYNEAIQRRNDIIKEIILLKKSIQYKIDKENTSTKILIDYIEEKHSKGYAIRQEALDNIRKKDKNGNISFRYLILLLLLIFLDSAAVIMKVLMPYGKHDKKLAELNNRYDIFKNKSNGEIENIKNKAISVIQKKGINIILEKPLKNDLVEEIKKRIDDLIEITNHTTSDINYEYENVVANNYSESYFNIPEKNIPLISIVLGFIVFLLLVYKFHSNDWVWFSTYGTAFSVFFSLIQPYSKKINL